MPIQRRNIRSNSKTSEKLTLLARFKLHHGILAAVVCTIAALIATTVGNSFASELVYYPRVCSGDWHNVDQAQGDYSGSVESPIEDRAALFDSGSGWISCSDFYNDDTSDAPISDATIQFAFTKKEVPSPEQAPTEQVPETVSTPQGDQSEPMSDITQPTPDSSDQHQSTNDSTAPEVPPESPQQDQTSQSQDVEQPQPEQPALAPSDSSADEGRVQISSLENDSPLFTVQYSFDGQDWKDLGVVTQDNIDQTFSVPVSTTQEVSSLHIALQNTEDMSKIPVYLDGMHLTIHAQEGIGSVLSADSIAEKTGLDDLAQTITDITNPADSNDDSSSGLNDQAEQSQEPSQDTPVSMDDLSQGHVTVDENARHSCIALPFTTDITDQSSKKVVIQLSDPKSSHAYHVRVGDLPHGIHAVFADSQTDGVSMSSMPDTETLEVTRDDDAATGSFTIPIIFSKESAQPSSDMICQFVIINSQ